MRALTYSDGRTVLKRSLRCPIRKPFIAQHAVAAGVTATRWWWVRHAPVREDNGCIYGQKDIGCDYQRRVVFDAVGKILPRKAVVVCEQAEAHASDRGGDLGRRLSEARRRCRTKRLRRTASRRMAGQNRAAFFASRSPVGSYWFAPIDEPAPGGESFMDLYNRVRAAIERINAEHAGQGRDRGGAWRHHQGGDRARARRPAGARGSPSHRQLLGDAARSSRERTASRLADADGQPAALDRATPRTPPCISRPGRRSCRRDKLA